MGIAKGITFEGELAYIRVDREGRVCLIPEDIERIANLVVEKLKDSPKTR